MREKNRQGERFRTIERTGDDDDLIVNESCLTFSWKLLVYKQSHTHTHHSEAGCVSR